MPKGTHEQAQAYGGPKYAKITPKHAHHLIARARILGSSFWTWLEGLKQAQV